MASPIPKEILFPSSSNFGQETNDHGLSLPLKIVFRTLCKPESQPPLSEQIIYIRRLITEIVRLKLGKSEVPSIIIIIVSIFESFIYTETPIKPSDDTQKTLFEATDNYRREYLKYMEESNHDFGIVQKIYTCFTYLCDVIVIFEDDILNYDRQVESKLNGQIASGNCVTIGSSRKNDFYLRKVPGVSRIHSIIIFFPNKIFKDGSNTIHYGFAYVIDIGSRYGYTVHQNAPGKIEYKSTSVSGIRQNMIIDIYNFDMFIRIPSNGKIIRQKFVFYSKLNMSYNETINCVLKDFPSEIIVSIKNLIGPYDVAQIKIQLVKLPLEIIYLILSFVDFGDLKRLRIANKLMKDIITDYYKRLII